MQLRADLITYVYVPRTCDTQTLRAASCSGRVGVVVYPLFLTTSTNYNMSSYASVPYQRLLQPSHAVAAHGEALGPPNWRYEIKLDGYRAIAFKTDGRVYLRSRNDNDFAGRYREIAKALTALPDETVIDGEIVALDES